MFRRGKLLYCHLLTISQIVADQEIKILLNQPSSPFNWGAAHLFSNRNVAEGKPETAKDLTLMSAEIYYEEVEKK